MIPSMIGKFLPFLTHFENEICVCVLFCWIRCRFSMVQLQTIIPLPFFSIHKNRNMELMPKGEQAIYTVLLLLYRRVSLKQTKNRFAPEPKNSHCFGVLNLYRNNRIKQNCFETNETNWNNPKFSENIKMLSIKLFRLVFCLFRFNGNTKNSLFRYRS